jgi:hypothetical protein
MEPGVRPGIAMLVATVFAIVNVLPFYGILTIKRPECPADSVHCESGLQELFFLPLLPFAGIGLVLSVILIGRILLGRSAVMTRAWWLASSLGAWLLALTSLIFWAGATDNGKAFDALMSNDSGAVLLTAFAAWVTTAAVMMRLLLATRIERR